MSLKAPYKISLWTIVFLSHLIVHAQIPETINFQGALTDPGTGLPVADGDYSIDFTLFDDISGGSSVWTETQGSVTVTNGLFNVQLGSQAPLSPSIFGMPLFLEISVGGDVLSPRIALATSPYSQASKSLIGSNYIPQQGNVHIGGNLNVGGVSPTIDLAIDDDDTGLEVPEDGHLAFYADGDERMRLTNSGNLGIGTSTPTEKLSVNGNIAANGNVKVDNFTYNTAKTLYYSIPAASFSVTTAASANIYMTGPSTGYYRTVAGGTGIDAYLFAPINLPQGAIIKAIEAHVYDGDATYALTVSLYRQPVLTSGSNLVATTSSSNDSGYQTISVSGLNEVVNNQSYAYMLRFVVKDNNPNFLVISNARITYTISGL